MKKLNGKQTQLVKRLQNPLLFKLFAWSKIPMLALSGVKVVELTALKCKVTVPFKHLNKNPFKSMYFAVQSMAAELSTASLALLALEGTVENMAYIVTGSSAEFNKKAAGKVTFECRDYELFQAKIKEALETGNGVEVTASAIGTLASGEEVSRFTFTWSFKKRLV